MLLTLLGTLGLLIQPVHSTLLHSHNLNTVRSLLDRQITPSYKENHLCETTPNVKSDTGYINIPANSTPNQPYHIHTFFWFFESRKDPANALLSLWLQGGPGAPSIPASLGENGPCRVTPDFKKTELKPWSWNNEVNMLHIDQPAQTGFSYDRLIEGIVDETNLPYVVTPVDQLQSLPELNSTMLLGTFPSQDVNMTANTTTQAARAAWEFMQIWMREFPVYKPENNKFSIWSESYGGHYGPTFADFFLSQTQKVPGSIPLELDTVGIVNGCIDVLTQMPSYPTMTFNNTYGVQSINETEYNAAMESFPQCEQLVENCRALANQKDDPSGTGAVEEANQACAGATVFCFSKMWLVNTAFVETGDFVLGRNLAALGELLDKGVKVALMYGDRDYQCNWYGGEAISLAINSTKFSLNLHKASYAPIQTNSTYIGGFARQAGNLSFSRVFDAGHEVPWYQPETAYGIFQRVMSNTDVSTGARSTVGKKGKCYVAPGLASVADVKNKLPAQEKSECYLWDVLQTCTEEQTEMLGNGTAVMRDFVLVGP
ncbi:Alpha/Beta hydrolase protein [Podospora fimiseda]|uniref:Carboxypeptidase n=1 Tax=Podospora fimiseda TaxID=252190 RepID=A0AAN6YM14_9PEZI|nr:Alpha/Beta hydrolase protein [Podospora fimiseda]